jgi:hypothetical protein
MAKNDVGLINAFKTYAEAEEHRKLLKNPDYFAILSMHTPDGTELYAPVRIVILTQLME